jgi:hypothetical protein
MVRAIQYPLVRQLFVIFSWIAIDRFIYRSQPRKMITKVGDPDFDLKIQVAIEQKMQAHKAHRDHNN